MRGKNAALCMMIAGSAMLIMPQILAGQAAELSLVFPRDGQIVAGTNVLVWAVRGDPDAAVVFEASLDGATFESLPPEEAPDFDFDSRTTALDSTIFPVGPLFLRARYASNATGPVIQVMVHRLPQVDCAEPSPGQNNALQFAFDCSASFSEDAEIVSYRWDFGDGTTLETSDPTTTHAYPGNGQFPFQMTAFDNLGFSSTFLATVTVGPSPLWSRNKCGCAEMVVSTNGNSNLDDPRRPAGTKAPLGQDPTYVSFNFDVTAALEEGSDPALCAEGQRIKRTSTRDLRPNRHKKACTAGRGLAQCDKNTDCDTFAGSGDGVCTEFPLAGADRGNDDYRFPSTVKTHCPTCQSPNWLDTPGLASSAHASIRDDYRYEADFLMFVNASGGGGSCSCHAKLLIDWDGANQVFRAGTGMTLVRDAENVNCR